MNEAFSALAQTFQTRFGVEAAEFRGDVSLVVPPEQLVEHPVQRRHLRPRRHRRCWHLRGPRPPAREPRQHRLVQGKTGI